MDQPIGLPAQERTNDGIFAVVPWRDFADSSGWDELARKAAEPNPFAERWCVEAGLRAFDRAGKAMIATLRVDGKLRGVAAVARRSRYEQYLLPHLAGWSHPNAFCGSPLVASGHEHAFWRALLAWADKHARSAMFLHLQNLPQDGPLYAALRDVCVLDRRRAAIVHRHERAMLRSDLAPTDYLDHSMTAKKRKELRRQYNRLAEEGTLAFERHEDAHRLDKWIEDFLGLEAKGWKGAGNSALANSPDTSAFFRSAIEGAATAGKLERLSITLGGRPIAMLANFICPPGAYSFKTTYDESLARYSPGVLLQRENLALLARDGIEWADSCAAADHPMIDRIWREKRPIARVSIAIGGRARRAAAALIFRAETGTKLQGL